MSDLQVANTILDQLGGSRFKAMTGAKDFLGSPDSLMFTIPTSKKINKVRITLKPDDTYRVEFMNYNRKKLEVTTINEVDGVYCDSLREVFTSATGLDTSL